MQRSRRQFRRKTSTKDSFFGFKDHLFHDLDSFVCKRLSVSAFLSQYVSQVKDYAITSNHSFRIRALNSGASKSSFNR